MAPSKGYSILRPGPYLRCKEGSWKPYGKELIAQLVCGDDVGVWIDSQKMANPELVYAVVAEFENQHGSMFATTRIPESSSGPEAWMIRHVKELREKALLLDDVSYLI